VSFEPTRTKSATQLPLPRTTSDIVSVDIGPAHFSVARAAKEAEAMGSWLQRRQCGSEIPNRRGANMVLMEPHVRSYVRGDLEPIVLLSLRA
jgi:hypothetical protein